MKKIVLLAVICLTLVPRLAFAAINSAYCTVTSSSASAQTLTGCSKVPNNVSFLQIHNPNASGSLAYTFDGTTPVLNAAGITLGPLGTATYDTDIPVGGLKLIATGTQTATINWKF